MLLFNLRFVQMRSLLFLWLGLKEFCAACKCLVSLLVSWNSVRGRKIPQISNVRPLDFFFVVLTPHVWWLFIFWHTCTLKTKHITRSSAEIWLRQLQYLEVRRVFCLTCWERCGGGEALTGWNTTAILLAHWNHIGFLQWIVLFGITRCHFHDTLNHLSVASVHSLQSSELECSHAYLS